MNLFSIEGNVGAGKSTVMALVKELCPAVSVLPEPLDVWDEIKTPDGRGILQAFYEDTKTYAFPFQMEVLVSRYEQLQGCMQSFPSAPILLERSILGDPYTFVECLFQSGSLTRLEHQVYLNTHKVFASLTRAPFFFLIDSSAALCYERIRQRNRPGEEKITLQYLQLLEAGIVQFMENYFERVIILDGRKPPRELAEYIVQVINKTAN